MAGGIKQHLAVLAVLQQCLGDPDFAGDDHPIGGRQRLAGDTDAGRVHAGFLRFAEHQIDDFIGNPVADLVRMSLGNRFRSEEVGRPRHGETPENGSKMR